MRVECPRCSAAVPLDDQSAGTIVRCRMCGKSFVAPAELAVLGKPHKLSSFSIAGLVLLHVVTFGVFTTIHLNLMHDKMPKVRKSDPSGFTAVALCFVPIVNLFWFFFTLPRLCLRVNEQRRLAGLAETAPKSFAVIVSTLLMLGFVGTILPLTGWVVLGATLYVLIPVFIALLQTAVNELVELGPDLAAGPIHTHGQIHRANAGHRDRDDVPDGQRRPVQSR